MGIFQFKQFQVIQKNSGAKITTDATVFGSVIRLQKSANKLLEIGAGTGVISLMLAQRYPITQIDAVEIEDAAADEASKNFKQSPYSHQLKLYPTDIQDFESPHQYDAIVSNPPFFDQHYKSSINKRKNIAYHTDSLSLKALATAIHAHLKQKGIAYLMLPVYEMGLLQQHMANNGFQVVSQIKLRHTYTSSPVRLFSAFSREKTEEGLFTVEDQVVIRTEENAFTEQYEGLMKPFLTIF